MNEDRIRTQIARMGRSEHERPLSPFAQKMAHRWLSADPMSTRTPPPEPTRPERDPGYPNDAQYRVVLRQQALLIVGTLIFLAAVLGVAFLLK